ncbi:hypothetical protein CZ771_06355 [Actinomycetales bacterium JB111]|nr:hypothetical protein CZ771_06355 [Actinomycetales bacterium JB111]
MENGNASVWSAANPGAAAVRSADRSRDVMSTAARRSRRASRDRATSSSQTTDRVQSVGSHTTEPTIPSGDVAVIGQCTSSRPSRTRARAPRAQRPSARWPRATSSIPRSRPASSPRSSPSPSPLWSG